MHEDSPEARVRNADCERQDGEHHQSAQKAGVRQAFAPVHIGSMFFARACKFGSRSRRPRRRSAMHLHDPGCYHRLRGFGFVLAR